MSVLASAGPRESPRFGCLVAETGCRFDDRTAAPGREGVANRPTSGHPPASARARRGAMIAELSVAMMIIGGACSTLALGLQLVHRLERTAALRDRAIERAVNLLERVRTIPAAELTAPRLASLAAAESRPDSLTLSAELLPPSGDAAVDLVSQAIVVRATWSGSDAAAQHGLTMTGWVTSSPESAP